MRALILDLARAFLDGFDRTAGRRDPVDEHAEQAREVLAEQSVPGPRRTTAPYDADEQPIPEWEIDLIGDSDREQLAEKLRKAWFGRPTNYSAGLPSRWLDVADVAIAELDSRANVPAPRDRKAVIETARRVLGAHQFRHEGLRHWCTCGWKGNEHPRTAHTDHVAEQLAAVGALGNLTKEGA